MRLALPLSLAAAVIAVGVAAYRIMPSGGAAPNARPAPVAARSPVEGAAQGTAPTPSGVRVIPTGPGATASRAPVPAAPRAEAAMAATSTAPSPSAPASGPSAQPAPQPDVLADVSRTLDGMRRSEEGGATGSTGGPAVGTAVAPAQREALRAMAARRKVRPVTRLPVPLEAGAVVPAQVYLHPVPPELEGLAPAEGRLGFAMVGDRFVVVGAESRKVVAVTAD